MLKLISIISLIIFNGNVDFVKVNNIECYSNTNKKIEFFFDISSDYSKSHELIVKIDLFESNNKLIGNYTNNLKIVGDRKATAKIDYLYKENIYANISVIYNGKEIESNIKFEFFDVEKCYLNSENKECNVEFKNVYKKGMITKELSDLKVLNAPYNDFLEFNKIDISKMVIYSNYDFSLDEVYLLIKGEIRGFDIFYEEGYKFPLLVIKENNLYKFSLLEEYYLSTQPFSFSESRNEKNKIVDELYFPFLDEYREYECSLIIKGIIEVEVEFVVGTSDGLFGECDSSKYCLIEVKYD